MPDVDIELPAGWIERTESTHRAAARIEYEYETADETIFIVSILPKTIGTGEFQLRFSTIDLTATHVRHDYPIDDYESLEAAVDDAESFIEVFSQRLWNGSISSVHPEMDAIRDTIQSYSSTSLRSSFQRLLWRFQ